MARTWTDAGRWNGRLTGRPLPLDDEALDALSPAVREELAQHWLERAASERRVGTSFTVIRDTLVEAAAHPELISLAERAIDDEMRHEEISRVVASRFHGTELPLPPALPFAAPEHPGASPALKRHLWVIGQCSLNETFASAVLEASMDVTTGTLAKAALRELLADEVDHARIGWAHLASLDVETKQQLQPRLASMVKANMKMWRETPRSYPSDDALLAHGALSAALIEQAIQIALEDLIIPGLQTLGFEVSALQPLTAPAVSPLTK